MIKMDTINLKVFVNDKRDLEVLKRRLDKERYCKPKNVISGRNYIYVKVSYPKYYCTSNAYLITSSEEVKQVNKDFVRMLEELRIGEIRIQVLRLDIPITINMKQRDTFHSYRNIFNYFARSYSELNRKSDPKTIMQELTQKKETYILADTKKASDYNSKITIYNQSKRFLDCYDDLKNKNINLKYRDLDTRIRIEVSKRLNRQIFSLDEFFRVDLYNWYYTDYIDYILDNLMNEFVLEDLYADDIYDLARQLEKDRRRSNFSYELFIHENRDLIKNYYVLRKAIEQVIERPKTRENAITRVRGILRRIEAKEDIILMDGHKEIRYIRKQLELLKKEHRRKNRR